MNEQDYYNTRECAEFLRVKPGTLRHWRTVGIGPNYTRIEGATLYPVADLREYLSQRKVIPSVRAALENELGTAAAR